MLLVVIVYNVEVFVFLPKVPMANLQQLLPSLGLQVLLFRVSQLALSSTGMLFFLVFVTNQTFRSCYRDTGICALNRYLEDRDLNHTGFMTTMHTIRCQILWIWGRNVRKLLQRWQSNASRSRRSSFYTKLGVDGGRVDSSESTRPLRNADGDPNKSGFLRMPNLGRRPSAASTFIEIGRPSRSMIFPSAQRRPEANHAPAKQMWDDGASDSDASIQYARPTDITPPRIVIGDEDHEDISMQSGPRLAMRTGVASHFNSRSGFGTQYAMTMSGPMSSTGMTAVPLTPTDFGPRMPPLAAYVPAQPARQAPTERNGWWPH